MSTWGWSRRGRLRCSESVRSRALGVRAAAAWRPRRRALLAVPAAGRVLAMRERIQGLVVLFRVRPAAEHASFATPWRAIGRTACDRPRFPRPIHRSSRTAWDHPRFPTVIPGGSRAASARGAPASWLPSLIAKRDHKAARRAAPVGADTSRPTPNHKAASHAATTPAPSASTGSPPGSTSAVPRGRSPSPASSAPSPRSSAPPARETSASRSASR
jgi:hypothetical protein